MAESERKSKSRITIPAAPLLRPGARGKSFPSSKFYLPIPSSGSVLLCLLALSSMPIDTAHRRQSEYREGNHIKATRFHHFHTATNLSHCWVSVTEKRLWLCYEASWTKRYNTRRVVVEKLYYCVSFHFSLRSSWAIWVSRQSIFSQRASPYARTSLKYFSGSFPVAVEHPRL